MSMQIQYKLASMEDLPAMIRAGASVFDHPVKPDRAKEFLEDPRHHLVLAYHDSEIIGIASGFHYVHPDKDPILFVNEVAVQENYQANGIGRTLVRLLTDYRLEWGCQEAWIATEGNNYSARKAFVAAGGVETSERVVLIEYGLEE